MKHLLTKFLAGLFFSTNLTSENLQALYTICLNVEVIQRGITQAAMFCFVFDSSLLQNAFRSIKQETNAHQI